MADAGYRRRASHWLARSRGGERLDRGGASAPGRGVRSRPLYHRGAQKAPSDMEAGALFGWAGRVGGRGKREAGRGKRSDSGNSAMTSLPASPFPLPATDQHGRKIEYLRISVTDRCNFRCLYCMPTEGLQWLPKSDILSYEEIAEVVAQLAPMGLRRLRITGGEPTIRPNLDELIRMLRAVPTVDDIALSTNGVRLPQIAELYRNAGLDRVNMSVDSLRPERL